MGYVEFDLGNITIYLQSLSLLNTETVQMLQILLGKDKGLLILQSQYHCYWWPGDAGVIGRDHSGYGLANEGWCYIVTASLIGWAHVQWWPSWYHLGRAESRFAPSQWETSLQSNAFSHWLGANLDSTLPWYSACKWTWATSLCLWLVKEGLQWWHWQPTQTLYCTVRDDLTADSIHVTVTSSPPFYQLLFCHVGFGPNYFLMADWPPRSLCSHGVCVMGLLNCQKAQCHICKITY